MGERRSSTPWPALILAATVGVVGAGGARAEATTAGSDLTELSLEELLAAEVTSVAKRPQRVDQAAAAVFVIGQEDIRRSGATSLPELLRMAPGMEVAELTNQGAAVSARGFNGRFSNKLLVLVDGRAVYLSTLSGVLWDQQLVPVEDIQRIEIVRGPGATLWGANAVDGVINIVTKHAVDGLGFSANLRTDSDEGDRAYARLGTTVGEAGALRLYAVSRSSREISVDGPAYMRDLASATQAGFRFDLEPTPDDAFTLQGDVQKGEFDATHYQVSPYQIAASAFPTDGDFHGHNLLGRWTRKSGPDRGTSVQIYWDHVERRELGVDGRRDQVDLDVSHHRRVGRHALAIGAGYRWTQDDVRSALTLKLDPVAREDTWYGAYVQDDVALIPERLNLSVGAKFEHNAYTGFELQPSVRAIWTDPNGWSLWTAVSRAVRTPSRLETGARLDSPIIAVAPSPDLEAETLIAYEAGWRGRLSPRVSLDVTAFHNVYDQLISWSMTPATGPGMPLLTMRFANLGSGTTTGAEAALDARLTDRWTVKAAASLLEMRTDPGGPQPPGFIGVFDDGVSPRSQLSVRSWLDLRHDLELDVWARHVAELRTGAVEPYTDLDVRLAWRPSPRLELFARGDNLLDEHRFEMTVAGIPAPAAVVGRRVELGLAVRY